MLGRARGARSWGLVACAHTCALFAGRAARIGGCAGARRPYGARIAQRDLCVYVGVSCYPQGILQLLAELRLGVCASGTSPGEEASSGAEAGDDDSPTVVGETKRLCAIAISLLSAMDEGLLPPPWPPIVADHLGYALTESVGPG